MCCVRTFYLGELISTVVMRFGAVLSVMCQSPSRRGTHFYQKRGFSIDNRMVCQSPPHRGTHFYGYESHSKHSLGRCQSPSHRGTHFYSALALRVHICAGVCVNPLHVGELISTRVRILEDQMQQLLCQSPSRRGTHFYLKRKEKKMSCVALCVNPLHLGELISTVKFFYVLALVGLCQSPSPRGTHFYASAS